MAHLENMDTKSKVRAGIIGHAIGDALGVPVEFTSRSQLARHPIRDMKGFGTHGMPAGTWSDDTSMEIALLQSLIDKGSFDYKDIMDNFCKWWDDDEFTATGRTFDIGGTCAGAISNFRMGMSPSECGEKGERSNGNGSLMRILPVAYVCYDNSIVGNDRYELVRKVSSLTHAHEISVLGCFFYINFIYCLLNGDSPAVAYRKAQQEDYSMSSDSAREAYHRILTNDIAGYNEDDISSSGYVLSSLEASLWCLLTTENYKEAVLKAVNLGSDTDTVGAITGSMAGIYYGYDAIPCEWVEKLQRSEYLLNLCDQFASTKIEV